MVYVIQVCWQLSANLYDIYHCCQWKTPDDEQRNCLKHVEFHPKNKFEKSLHLVGFIIRNLSRCTVTRTSKRVYILCACVCVSLSTRTYTITRLRHWCDRWYVVRVFHYRAWPWSVLIGFNCCNNTGLIAIKTFESMKRRVRNINNNRDIKSVICCLLLLSCNSGI